MQKLIITKGISGSGKSKYAEDLINKDSNYVRIEKDLIKEMLFEDNWTPKKEKLVLKTRDTLIQLYLSLGKSVIVSDTNLHPKHEIRIRQLVDEYNTTNNASVTIEIKFFDVDIETCVKRDLKRLKSVGRDVIEEQYYTYIKPYKYDYNYNPKLPDCIIADLDGTLAINPLVQKQKGNWEYQRSFYDPTDEDVEKDLLCKQVQDAIEGYYNGDNDIKLFVFSGREDSCRKGTEKWLRQIDYDELYMRESGDNRPDTIVKKEMYDEHIKDKYNVLAVFEDKNSVIEMWRDLGLYVFDCNQRGFRF